MILILTVVYYGMGVHQYTNVYFKLLTMVDPEAKAKAKARKATLKLYPSPKN